LLTRPPLILSGGDLIQIDRKTALTSRATLEANGGRTDYFEEVLNKYMGIEKVYYLDQLPGETIEHLDFIVQAFGPDTILVASPVDFDDLGRISNKILREEMTKILKRNREIIQKRFPDHTIIEVPMPPPIMESNDEIRTKILREILQSLGSGMEFSNYEFMEIDDAQPSDWNVPSKLMNKLFLDTGVLNLDSTEAIDKVISQYSDRPINDILRIYTNAFTYYRTYLNSLQIMGDDGQEYIILPRYEAHSPEERALLEKMESDVLKAYAKARPNAKFLWMDCSYIINKMGAVHCMAITIPEHQVN
jgi:agmatine/peptidylarginine deiminase